MYHLDFPFYLCLQEMTTRYLAGSLNLEKIMNLIENIDANLLVGMPGYRFRIGDYRVIFDHTDVAIIVLRVGHRKDIYK